MMHFVLALFRQRWLRDPPVTLRAAALLAAVLAYGASGFLYFELPGNPDLTWGDGIWYTLVTLTTIGYGDFYPKTAGGRYLVAIPVMVIGIGLLGYLLSIAASALVASKTREHRGMSAFGLTDHLVVFNYPAPAKILSIVAELRADPSCGARLDVVLVDEHLAELPPELAEAGVRFVRGNPSRDDTLRRASIDTARHAVVLSRQPGDPASDNANVAIVLAIEKRAARVKTVVECIDPASRELLRKAGCDQIVCPTQFEALFVSHELLNPGAHDVLQDLISGAHGHQLYLTAVVHAESVTYAQLRERCAQFGHTALGLKRQDRNEINPAAHTAVNPGDLLISIGAARLPADALRVVA